MLEEDPRPGSNSAEDLLRQALLDDSSSVAVSLKVGGLPLSESVTVIFHGRRDLGTLQTYVTRGSRGAGATVAASELLRVPCDPDLADDPERCVEDFLEVAAEHARVLAERLDHQEASVERFLELSE